jgi:hypothetical protein
MVISVSNENALGAVADSAAVAGVPGATIGYFRPELYVSTFSFANACL